jgi:phytoene synthase
MTLAALVRKHDPDRYFTALFAPAVRREALFALYAFNHELARAREAAAREPGLALIRLQWWREVVEGAVRQHEVAAPLGALLAEGLVPRALLLSMIDMREAEAAGPPATLADFLALMRQGPGALALAAGAALGQPLDRLQALGAAFGVAGTLRNVPALARHGRCALPVDVLASAGLVPEAVVSDPALCLEAARPALRAAGEELLGARRRIPAAVRAAALPAVLARRDLARDILVTERAAGDRLAVLAAAWTGMV